MAPPSSGSPASWSDCFRTRWPSGGADRRILQAGGTVLAIETVRRAADLAQRDVRRQRRSDADVSAVDKQIPVRRGQANVKRWVDEILPLLGRARFIAADISRDESANAWERTAKDPGSSLLQRRDIETVAPVEHPAWRLADRSAGSGREVFARDH